MKTKMCPMCGGECLPENGDFVCTCCGYTIEGEQPAPVRLSYKEDDGESVYSAVAGAVAEIKCNFSGGSAAGSGFLISRDGYCVTNAHVVTDSETFCPAKQIFVTVAGETVSALLIAVGDKRAGTGGGIDLALLKLSRVPYKASPVAFGSSAAVRNGQTVYVVGNSLGMGTCITKGIVSDRERVINGKSMLMTDCATNHGNSGGPVFDSSAKVVGAVVAGIEKAEGMNFAIRVDDVKAFLRACGVRI